jgi:hypothetical protein
VKQTVLVSDISGDTITDGDGATVSIKFDDARKGTTVLDVKASEVTDLVEKGRKQARGRRPRRDEDDDGGRTLGGEGGSTS